MDITLKDLEDMFENIQTKSKWDVKKPLLRGYFFTNQDSYALTNVADVLEKQGYTIVKIYQNEAESGKPGLWWLHVEKAEVHTPKSLLNRNAEFYELAEEYSLDSYDGMDVGLVEQKTK